jgi:hypothetical protein
VSGAGSAPTSGTGAGTGGGTPVVSNTTPFITLAGVGLLDTLQSLYAQIWIPDEVFAEYQAGTANPLYPSLVGRSWIVVHLIPTDPRVPPTALRWPRQRHSAHDEVGETRRTPLCDERHPKRRRAIRIEYCRCSSESHSAGSARCSGASRARKRCVAAASIIGFLVYTCRTLGAMIDCSG